MLDGQCPMKSLCASVRLFICLPLTKFSQEQSVFPDIVHDNS